jgi:hypothetical protein
MKACRVALLFVGVAAVSVPLLPFEALAGIG